MAGHKKRTARGQSLRKRRSRLEAQERKKKLSAVSDLFLKKK